MFGSRFGLKSIFGWSSLKPPVFVRPFQDLSRTLSGAGVSGYKHVLESALGAIWYQSIDGALMM